MEQTETDKSINAAGVNSCQFHKVFLYWLVVPQRSVLRMLISA